MIHDYPYTDFHELNLDYIMMLAHKALGLHLVIDGDFLELHNKAGDVISKVKISYAETALKDTAGHNITAYVIDAGLDGRRLVLTRGNGEEVYITIPYAESAEKDINGADLTSYIKNINVSGDSILVTLGNGSTYTFTVPYAVKASKDANEKLITTYVAELSTANDKLIVRDGEGVVLAELTIPYAIKARDDVDGDAIKETYGHALTTGVTTVMLRDKVGNVLSEITTPYAVKASQDNAGNALLSDYGYQLEPVGNKIALNAHDGTKLNEVTVPFATVSTDATNAIEAITLSGDNVKFITFGGQSYEITVPYAVKALKDNLNNTLSRTYIANAVNDPNTGKITFYAQDGSVIAEMTPTVDSAVHDSNGNVIADYVKTIVTDPNSNYVTVTHGDGASDTLTINYSAKAWKDTYGNIIGNAYIRSLAIETDANTGHKVLIAYNGELAELFRLDIESESAVTDINGKDITSYVSDVTINNDDLIIEHGDGTQDTVNLPGGFNWVEWPENINLNIQPGETVFVSFNYSAKRLVFDYYFDKDSRPVNVTVEKSYAGNVNSSWVEAYGFTNHGSTTISGTYQVIFVLYNR